MFPDHKPNEESNAQRKCDPTFRSRLCVAVEWLAAPADNIEAVDLFEAMNAGQVAVRFIPSDAAKANVLIENKTDHVLHVELPDAFAAVPVLAQLGPDPAGNGGGGGGTQGVGGGLNFGGPNAGRNGQAIGNGGGGGNRFGRGGGQGIGMGVMRIAAEKTRKLTATTVCLEHGKPEPNPRIAYRMIPIEEFAGNDQVAELCRQLGRGSLAQKTAQAAAWQLANGMSWEKIATLNRIESKYLGSIKFFQPNELARAKEFVESLSTPTPDAGDYATARIAFVVTAFMRLSGEKPDESGYYELQLTPSS